MSRLFEGLTRANIQRSQPDTVPPDMVPTDLVLPEPAEATEAPRNVIPKVIGATAKVEPKKAFGADKDLSIMAQPPPTSRLVAWTEPNSLGAEKFRALVVRLDHMRKQHELKSVQVTSSVINEGKTFVSANLAVTLAKYSGAKTLLIEGDLHRPTLASLFGLKELPGLGDWWLASGQDIARFLIHLTGTGLWFLPAGKSCDRPSDILRSAQIAAAFSELTSLFDWIVVDSTPMLPVIDANLWSRMVDGTLLVVREGVAPLKAIKSGLQSLDHPKLIGVVVNGASEFGRTDYDGQYYGARKYENERREKLR